MYAIVAILSAAPREGEREQQVRREQLERRRREHEPRGALERLGGLDDRS
jgi:hypothetical protein